MMKFSETEFFTNDLYDISQCEFRTDKMGHGSNFAKFLWKFRAIRLIFRC